MIKKIIELISYWGIINLTTKAYEKIVIDYNRYAKIQTSSVKHSDSTYKYNKSEPTVYKELEGYPLKSDFGGTIIYLVHQFYPLYQGGTEIFTKNLAIGMKKLGYKVIVLTLEYERKDKYTNTKGNIMYRQYDYDGLEVIGFRYRRTPKGMLYKEVDSNNEDLKIFADWIINQYKPMIVHCTYPQPMVSFLNRCYTNNIPYIVTLTDFNMACHYATKVNKQGLFCENSNEGKLCGQNCSTRIINNFTNRYNNALECLQRAVKVTVPSEFAANIISSEFKGIKLWVVPHGIKEFSVPLKESSSSIMQYTYVGKLTTIKGVYQLIKAYKEADIPESNLCIYGTGSKWYKRRLISLIGKDKRIIIKGQIEHEFMGEVYSQSQVVVIPSLCYETYNYVVREAVSQGCMVIGSDRGAIAEVITPEVGWVVDMTSKTMLIDALQLAKKKDGINKKVVYQTIDEEVFEYQQLYRSSMNLDDIEERKVWIH